MELWPQAVWLQNLGLYYWTQWLCKLSLKTWTYIYKHTTNRFHEHGQCIFFFLHLASSQFCKFLCSCSVAQSCLTFCNRMDCSMQGFPVLHHHLELTQNSCPLSRWCHPTISFSFVHFSSCIQSVPRSGAFLMNQLLSSGGQKLEH